MQKRGKTEVFEIALSMWNQNWRLGVEDIRVECYVTSDVCGGTTSTDTSAGTSAWAKLSELALPGMLQAEMQGCSGGLQTHRSESK